MNNSNLTDDQIKGIVTKYKKDASFLSAETLTGGVSADITAITLKDNNNTEKIVVRLYGDKDLKSNPAIATEEYNLMQSLTKHKAKVPTSYFYDNSRTLLSKPYVVIQFINGDVQFETTNLYEYIEKSIAELVVVHSIPVDGKSENLSSRIERILDIKQKEELEGIFKKIFDVLVEGKDELIAESRRQIKLLHGDFWPGNIMWDKNNEVAAIIDWEDNAIGNPLYDLASARLEYNWVFGCESVKKLTDCYESNSKVDLEKLYLFDLLMSFKKRDFINWFDDPSELEEKKNLYEAFVNNAISQLT